jgi:hypothetical protein
LDGAFTELQSVFTHSFHTYPVIHGITSEGQAVRCIRTGFI